MSENQSILWELEKRSSMVMSKTISQALHNTKEVLDLKTIEKKIKDKRVSTT